jgi:hypothetical protein
VHILRDGTLFRKNDYRTVKVAHKFGRKKGTARMRRENENIGWKVTSSCNGKMGGSSIYSVGKVLSLYEQHRLSDIKVDSNRDDS